MSESSVHRLWLRNLTDDDLPADQLERLARVDALLRFAAAHDADRSAAQERLPLADPEGA